MRRILLLSLLAFVYSINRAQTIYTYNGKYRIELPDKLELQDSELNTIRRLTAQGNKAQVNVSTSSGHITFQQKGLNADVKDAYNKYCRVIVEYFQEDINEPTFGRGDQIVVDKDLLYMVHERMRMNCVKDFLYNFEHADQEKDPEKYRLFYAWQIYGHLYFYLTERDKI